MYFTSNYHISCNRFCLKFLWELVIVRQWLWPLAILRFLFFYFAHKSVILVFMCRVDGKFQLTDFILFLVTDIFSTFNLVPLIQKQATVTGNIKIKGQYYIYEQPTKTTQCVVSPILIYNRCICMSPYKAILRKVFLSVQIYYRDIKHWNADNRWQSGERQFTEILYSISNRKIVLDESLFHVILVWFSEYTFRPINLPSSGLPKES
jgi:hypothetical protein